MSDVYVTGRFRDQSFNLYNGDNLLSGIVLQNSTGGGGAYNAYLAKYNSDGRALWGAPMGGLSNSAVFGNGVTVDLNGNAFVTGYFTDQSFNLYNGDNSLSGVVLQNSTGGDGAYNAFLAKYDSDGTALWGVPMGGFSSSALFVNGVTVDLTGNVYVTGYFSDQSFNLYNGDNSLSGVVLQNSTGGGAYNAYLAKYDSDGKALWGAPMGDLSNPTDRGIGVTVDITGNVYVTGSFRDQSFNLYNGDNSLSGVVLQNSTGSGGYNNAYLAKYNSDGTAQWGAPMGGLNNPNDYSFGVKVDINDNIYVIGSFRDELFNLYNGDNSLSDVVLQNSSGGGGAYNAFLAKYNSDGRAQWGAPMGGFSSSAVFGNGVTIDMDGYIYVIGRFNDKSFNLYHGDNSLFGVVIHNSTGGINNSFLAKYDSDGKAQWGAPMGGIINPAETINGVSFYTNGDVYLTSMFYDQSFNLYSYQNPQPPFVLQNSVVDGFNLNNTFLGKCDSQFLNLLWGADWFKSMVPSAMASPSNVFLLLYLFVQSYN
jgi:hypothetical protein